MKNTDRMRDQTQVERRSTISTSKLVFGYNTKLTDEEQFNQQAMSIKTMQDDPEIIEETSEFSLPENAADKQTFRGPHSITAAITIIWYIGICILFVIAFLALALSVLYFITDSSVEQVIKLYGITGSGSLAIVTFGIIFLDCFIDADRDDHEEEVIYRVLQIKDTRDKELARRRNRRVAVREREKRKPSFIQHQRSQQVPKSPAPPPPPPPPTCHHHHYPQPHHVHHIHSHSPHSYHTPYIRSYYHDSHTPKYHRYNHIDVGVNTSDGFEPMPMSVTPSEKFTRDAQMQRNLGDAERGAQADRTEGTQTLTTKLKDTPNYVTEIIHETKILKSPRSPLPTLKQSIEQQDQYIEISGVAADTNSTTV